MRKAIGVYYLYTGLTTLFFMMVFSSNMVYQVETAGLNPLQLVLVGTVLELSVLLFEVPTGIVADLYTRKGSIIIGSILVGCGFMIEGNFPSFLPILIAQIVWGFGYTFTSGALIAWITDEIGQENVANVLLRGSQLEEISGIVGTLAGVILASIRLNIPILLAGGGFVVLGFLLLNLMPENGFKSVPAQERHTFTQMAVTFRDGMKLLNARKALIYLMVFAFFLGLYSEGFDRLWTPHLLTNLSFPNYLGVKPVVWFGLMTTAGGLLTLGAVEFVRRKMEQSGSQILILVLILSSGSLSIFLLIFALTANIPLAVATWLVIYVLRRAVSPVYTIWFNERLSSNLRATMLSFSGQVDALGQVLGGPPVGWLGKTRGVSAGLLASALLVIPAALVLVPILKRRNLSLLEGDGGQSGLPENPCS